MAEDNPRTGDGKKSNPKKIGKEEVNVQKASGTYLWKQIAKLWGKKK